MNKKFLFWIFLFIFLSTYNYSGNKVKILDFFLIKKIEIQGINNADKNEIFILLKKIRGKNIIFLKRQSSPSRAPSCPTTCHNGPPAAPAPSRGRRCQLGD